MNWFEQSNGQRSDREEDLRSELNDLRLKLDLEQARHHELKSSRRGIASDGTVTVRESQLLHEEARVRYVRTLKLFADLVLGG